MTLPSPAPANTGVRWHVHADDAALVHDARTRVLDAASEAITQRGAFDIVLAGGNTPRKLYRALRASASDWARWHIWFGDERCLPTAHPDRNSTMASDEWLAHVAIPADNIHVIAAELGGREAAMLYARALRSIDAFDLVLLGLGEDGHTASLFPGHDLGMHADSPAVLAVADAPKPPPERVTLGAQRLSHAQHVLFLVEGAGKCAAIGQWRRGGSIPAAAITPVGGVDVLLDQAAAQMAR